MTPPPVGGVFILLINDESEKQPPPQLGIFILFYKIYFVW